MREQVVEALSWTVDPDGLVLRKPDWQATLASLGVRPRYTAEEVELAVAETLCSLKDHVDPDHYVAACGGQRKINRSHPESTERKMLRKYRAQLEWAKARNRVTARLTLYKLVQTCFKTLPKGSEVKLSWIPLPDFRNYKLRVSWRPGYYGPKGRANLRFELAWFSG